MRFVLRSLIRPRPIEPQSFLVSQPCIFCTRGGFVFLFRPSFRLKLVSIEPKKGQYCGPSPFSDVPYPYGWLEVKESGPVTQGLVFVSSSPGAMGTICATAIIFSSRRLRPLSQTNLAGGERGLARGDGRALWEPWQDGKPKRAEEKPRKPACSQKLGWVFLKPPARPVGG